MCAALLPGSPLPSRAPGVGRRALLAASCLAAAALTPACSGEEASSIGAAGAGGAGGQVYPGDTCQGEGQTRPCYPGAPATQNMGECRDGTNTCADDRWSDCTGYQLPQGEACNGLDDDCNGVAEDGACGNGGSGGAPAGLRLYRRDFSSAVSSFASQPVSEVWTGDSAPPPDGILVAESSHGVQPPWLFVVADDGNFYVRQGSTWLAPQPVSLVFSGLDAAYLNTLSAWQPEPGSPQAFELTARTKGVEKHAYYYAVDLPSLAIQPDPNNPYVVPDDPDPDAPPHNVVDLDWSFAYQTAYLGTEHWVMFYMQCGANVYLFDGGDFDVANLGPAEQSTVWGADPAAGPASGSVVAAWMDGSDLCLLAP
ncbi:MAG: hypothetical protein HY744_25880 [Deltaproteobacteria bacterium]|nr:hypothetical protein [Deltaproteobacteria bacterium]